MSRTGLGLAQGAALYLLYISADAALWPATHPTIFAPLLMVAVFVPMILVQGLGNMRPGRCR